MSAPDRVPHWLDIEEPLRAARAYLDVATERILATIDYTPAGEGERHAACVQLMLQHLADCIGRMQDVYDPVPHWLDIEEPLRDARSYLDIATERILATIDYIPAGEGERHVACVQLMLRHLAACIGRVQAVFDALTRRPQ